MPAPEPRRGTLGAIDPDATTPPATDPATGGFDDDGTSIPPVEGPSTPPPRTRIPKQVWAAIAGLGVIIVIAGYFASQMGTPSPLADGPGEGSIEALVPPEGAEVLQQGRFGIDLAPGWEATLAVNDVVIPDDQLTVIPELNQVFFIPGPDKLIERLPAGDNCVTARFWPSARGQEASQVRTWCFSVT